MCTDPSTSEESTGQEVMNATQAMSIMLVLQPSLTSYTLSSACVPNAERVEPNRLCTAVLRGHSQA